MVVENGVEIGRVLAAPAAAARDGGIGPGFELSGRAVADLVIDTARGLAAEIPGLGRLKWW